jgi:hypothetical protein
MCCYDSSQRPVQIFIFRLSTQTIDLRTVWGNLRERDRWGDPGVDGRIILGWIFKKWDGGVKTGLGWLRIGTGGGRL